ncbi:MAG TPA: hypothetical protein VET23_15930, partial [Chitinophagaceae bacterium]|nr:hypothetical protein [Chitinophagaceae bacterium]
VGLSATTGATVTASTTTTTTYTVTGTITATGCQNSATSTVLGTPLTPVLTPASINLCLGNTAALSATATFNVAVSGNLQSYQWQLSTGGGPFTNIAGANNSSLVLAGTTVAMSGNQYRVVITNSLFNR